MGKPCFHATKALEYTHKYTRIYYHVWPLQPSDFAVGRRQGMGKTEAFRFVVGGAPEVR